MKKRMICMLLTIVMVVCLFPVTAFAEAATNIKVSDPVYYDSGALKSITTSFGWSGALPSGCLVLTTKYLRSEGSNGYTYGDFSDMGYYAKNFNFRTFDDVLAHDQAYGDLGIITYTEQKSISSSNNSRTFNFTENNIPLSKNGTYYVYFWTYYWGEYYPDNLIMAIEVKNGGVSYTVADSSKGRNALSGISNQVTSRNTYNVTVTAAENMTKTDDSGAATQPDLNSAMTPVVFKANDGYTFPENYAVATTNGIMVRRDNAEQITVFGTPTSNTTITLPAPTSMGYRVSFDANGGTGTVPTQDATAQGSTFTIPDADGLTKDGYTFSGWNDGEKTYAAGDTYTMPAKNVTFTAKWKETVERYDVWVGGVQVTSANKDHIVVPGATGSVTYDPDTKTLTLDNFNYEGKGYMYSEFLGYGNYAAVYSGMDLTVKLVGTNTVTSSVTDNEIGAAFYVQGVLTITDDTADNTDSVLKLTGCNGDGLFGEGVLTIENVTVKSTGVFGCGIYCKKAVNINNAIVNIASDNSQALYSYNAITVNDSNVTVSSGAHIGVLLLKSNEMNISNSTVEITAGSEKNAIYVAGSGDNELGKEFAPVFDSAVIVTAGDDAASATAADAKASETYKNRYVKILPVCTVTVHYGIDGVDDEEIRITKGNTISLETPAIDGCLFMGWFTDDTYQTPFDPTAPITESITVYAKFFNYEGDKKALQDAIDDLETAVNNVETALNHKVSTEKLAEEVGKLNQAIADAKAYADTQDAALKASLEAADATMNTAITALQNRVTALEAGLTAANDKINANESDIDTLKTDVSTLKTWQTEAQNAIEALETLTGTQGTNISALQTAVAELQATMNTANGKIAAAENRIAALEDKVSALETAKTNLENAVSALQTAVADKADTATVNAAIAELQTAIEALEAVKDDYVTADATLKAELEGKIANAQTAAISAAEILINNAKVELQAKIDAKADAATTTAAIQNLQAAVAALEAVKDDYATADATLKAELEGKIETAKSEAITAANTALTTAKNELIQAIALKADTATLNAKVDALNTAIANAESVAKAYADTQDASLKAELQTAIANAKSDLEALIGGVQSDLDATKAKLDKAIEDLNKAITDGDKDLSDEIAALNTALTNAKAALEKADADNKAELVSKIETADATLDAAIKAVQKNLDDAKAELDKAIADGDSALDEKISNLNIALNHAIAVLEQADTDNKAELVKKIEEADGSLQAAIDKVASDLAKAQKDLADAIAIGDAALSRKIHSVSTSLIAAKTALEKADADNKAALEAKIEAAESILDAAIKAVQKNLDDAKAELDKAIANGDTALDGKISALNEALATAKAAFEATDSANKSELTAKIDEAYASLDAAIKAVQKNLDEVKTALEKKDNELQTFIMIVCVISGVAFCGCATLAVFYMIDKKKKSK